jgi:hypothetical protein
MSDIFNPDDFDKELFGADFQADFPTFFDDNQDLFDFDAAALNPVEATPENSANLPTTITQGVSLADIENPGEFQSVDSSFFIPQDNAGYVQDELSGESVDYSFFVPQDDAAYVRDELSSESLAGEESRSVTEDTEASPPAPSFEEILAENARLKALLAGPKVLKTPPKKISPPKASKPRKTATHRVGKASPVKQTQLSPASLAIAQQVGPIEEMWAPTTSPERRKQIEQQQYAGGAKLLSAPRFFPPNLAAVVQRVPVDAAQDNFEKQLNDLLASDARNSSFPSDGLNSSFTSDNDIFSTSPQQIWTSSPAATPTPERYTTPQLTEGAIMYNGSMYGPAAGTTPSPPAQAKSTPKTKSASIAMSPPQTVTPTPTPSRKARAPAKPRATTQRSNTASANKVTKPKKATAAHKRNASAPTPVTTAVPRPLHELQSSPFVSLTHEERCRLLLPLLQGIDPTTGQKIAAPGLLAQNVDFEAIGEDLVTPRRIAPAVSMSPSPASSYPVAVPALMHAPPPAFNMDFNMQMQMQSGASPTDKALVEEAAQDLGMGVNMEYGGANRQNEALQRAEMLRAMGRRR